MVGSVGDEVFGALDPVSVVPEHHIVRLYPQKSALAR